VSSVPTTKRYVAHVVLWVGVFLAIPLWREFHEPSQPLWNVFLALFLVALVVGAFFGVRYLQKNNVEVGEARFTTTDAERG
jgi:succinate dehydrogenase hydrophobic anchor subunit